MLRYLSTADLDHALALRDLTDPDQGHHAVQLVLQQVIDGLTNLWAVPTTTIRTSPLVAVADNYDNLGYQSDAVTRDERYSRYVSPTVMLRSHTSAGIPAHLRTLFDDLDCDRLCVLPGLVYRRDVVDRTHVGAPHQVDLWRIRNNADRLAASELLAMVERVVTTVLPGADWRTVRTYTVHGLQIDVRIGSDWLELAECGLMAPHVVASAGLDPQRWSGLALGMGLDRALMLRKGIPDIRMLRAQDPRVVAQMSDLTPWRAVSMMPPIRRDLSLVLDADVDAEIIGDGVRAALGDRADDLESIDVLAVTRWADLPLAARERLGLRADQTNTLLRLVLRSVSATLTNREANSLRDDVYRALHEGPVLELIEV